MRQAKLFLWSGLFVVVNLVCAPSRAAESDKDFRQYVRGLCENNIDFVSVFENFQLCTELFEGSTQGSVPTGRDSIVVIDTPPVTSGTTVKNRLNQIRNGSQGYATASAGDSDEFGFFGGGLGIFATGLSGDTERSESELENGFDSDQDGSAFGLDYRFADLILGVTFGSIDNDTLVAGGGSRLRSDSDSKIIYATWAPADGLSLDIYSGSVDTHINTLRDIEISSINTLTGLPNTITGVARGSTESEQDLQGASLNYDHYVGAWSVGAFIGLDSIDTETDAYDETGQRDSDPAQATGLELSYPALKMKSKTRSLGVRVSYGADFGWGTLAPSLKIATVRESEAKGRQIGITLRTAPDTVSPFSVATDSADRNYTLANFGLVALMAGGSVQLFLDYEKHSGDKYIDGTATTLGVLVGF
jgi:hypothetical protein